MGVALMVGVMCAPFLAIPAGILYGIRHYKTRDERNEWAKFEQAQRDKRERDLAYLRKRYPHFDEGMEEEGFSL